MIDVEEQLRRSLSEVADSQRVPADFDARVTRRVAVHRRRRRVVRAGLATVVILAVALVGVMATRDTGSRLQKVVGEPGPVTGWLPIADAPIEPRAGVPIIVMGDRMLVWGGAGADSAVYDVRRDRWTKAPPAPLPKGDGVGVWDGREAIVVASDDDGHTSAAAFDPDRSSWRQLADAPLQNAASAADHAIWTGSEVVVIGVATEIESVTTSEVAIYDPETDTWRSGTPTTELLPDFGDAVWTGNEIAIVGRVGDSGRGPGSSTVNLYNPFTDRWRSIPWGLPAQATNPVVAWTGDRLFIGGGGGVYGGPRSREAALVDVTTGDWERLADAPIGFAGNHRFGEIWTGEAVLTLNGDGGRPVTFDPSTRTWTVGSPDATGGLREEAGWSWLVPSRTAVVWGGGTIATLEQGIRRCCSPIEDGERYTP
jgi:hypothetical protein